MTHHSDTEISELAEYLVRCCEQSYGASALVMLPAGSVRKAASALQSLLADKARMEELDRASADAIDVADNIIAINCGIDTPKEWNRAIAKVVKARAALSTITPKEAE